MVQAIRTRFAPSPTGFVHVGGLRTALYNYIFAKKNHGTFVLRIEDTDRKRLVPGALENLLKVLKWAGLDWDEGPDIGGPHKPYVQSERLQEYRKYAHLLVQHGHAYYAFDTDKELEAMRTAHKTAQNPNPKYDHITRAHMRNSLTLSEEQTATELAKGTPYTIRLFVPQDSTFEFADMIRGQVSFRSDQVDDTVLLKSDGWPTYHLGVVVDDYLMEITHVIRGEEWLSSVPKHLLLYRYFGWDPPLMAHLPLIFNPDGTKMSKRDITSLDELPPGKVDADVESYIRQGYEREAILNHIALLGWNPGEGDDRQVFTMDDLVQEFSLEHVNKAAAIFDIKKLNWINSEHVRKRSDASLVEQVKVELMRHKVPVPSDDYVNRVIGLLKTRVHFSGDFFKIGRYFFIDPEQYDEQTTKKHWKGESAKLVLEFLDEIVKLTLFNTAELEAALRRVAEKNQVGSGQIIHPIRLAVSGTGVGPGLFELLEVIGKDVVGRRIHTAVARMSGS